MKKHFRIIIDSKTKSIERDVALLNEPYTEKGITAFYMGSLYVDNKKAEPKDYHSLYRETGENMYREIDGSGAVGIIDTNKDKVFVFTDFFNSCFPVYICKKDSKTVISNDIKSIILYFNEAFSFDDYGIKIFLQKGFVDGEHTIVSGINKIPGKHYLKVDATTGEYEFVRCMNIVDTFNFREINHDMYDNAIDDVVKSFTYGNLASPLSSGFDTNMLMHHVRKHIPEGERVTSYCIGGAIGWNEIARSKEIAEYYGNVDLKSALVDGDTFNCYPEIVSILEGAIYEHGIFLQYALANLAKKDSPDRIVLGECADQVSDHEFWYPEEYEEAKQKRTIEVEKALEEGKALIPYRDIYEIACCKINKKSGIMLNHYGIEAEYPYLRREVVDTCVNVVKKGDKKKSYHKEVIYERLPEFVTSEMSKKPGATELRTLYIGDIDFDDVKKFAKKSPYYRDLEFDDEFYEIHYYMKLMYIELFRSIFLDESHRAWLKGEEQVPKLACFIEK